MLNLIRDLLTITGALAVVMLSAAFIYAKFGGDVDDDF
jgi:hypothetical protein